MKVSIARNLDWLRIGAEYAAVILLFFHLLPEQFLENWKQNGLAAIMLIGVCLVFALYLLYKERTHQQAVLDTKNMDIRALENKLANAEKLSSYSSIFPLLNKAFSELHNGVRNNLTQDEFKNAFKDFCTQLAYAFEKVTGQVCHVCIKIPVVPANGNNRKITRIKAKTFVRDSLRVNRDMVDSLPIDHSFLQNTDYEHIFNNISSDKGRFFFCNDLPALSVYKNTSFLKDGASSQFFRDSVSVEEKKRDWPLPYRSSITAAICPGITNQRDTGTLFGFLCIDSPAENAFNEMVDPEILSGCADGLYNPLKLYLVNKKSNNEQKAVPQSRPR